MKSRITNIIIRTILSILLLLRYFLSLLDTNILLNTSFSNTVSINAFQSSMWLLLKNPLLLHK
jgi:hypothetical protein